MNLFRIAVAVLALVCAFPGGAAALDCPPSPAPDDFVLPGPGGACFAFRAVVIGEGESGNPYVHKIFTMGDQVEEHKGTPVKVLVGAPFEKSKESGMSAWFYYLGKYEVTEGQYYKVMGLPKGADPKLLDSEYPMAGISYLEAQNFINTLNLWLYANAPDALPKRGKTPGFLRLPTEAEWEFAARGGLNAAKDQFSARHPYGDDGNLPAHEWFSGPTSSHDKVQPVGKLKPNPLGLHDMLGNVSEMVQTAYQLEYYQGNAGGVTARGGHFVTTPKYIRVSFRVEQDLYRPDGNKGFKPNTSKTTGFRLAVGCTVLSNREIINALKDGWEKYRQGSEESPAQSSTAPVEQRAGQSIDETKAALRQIREKLKGADVPDSVFQALGNVEAGIDSVTEMRRRADEDIVSKFTEIGALTGLDGAQTLVRINSIEGHLQNSGALKPEILARMKNNHQEAQRTLSSRMDMYMSCIQALGDAGEAVVANEVKKLRSHAEERDFGRLLYFIDLLEKHLAQFRKDRKLDTAAWKEDFSAVPKEVFMDKNKESK